MGDFQLRRQNNISYLVCERVEREGFIAAFSTRHGGVSDLPKAALNLGHFPGDARENVEENRRRFLAAIGAGSKRLATMHQVHGAETAAISSASITSAPQRCDGMITADESLLLGAQTADRLPVLIADPESGTVAAIHAGWRGTAARVVERTLARMRLELGVETGSCFALLGPSARNCCYEIGDDVAQIYRKSFGYARRLISKHADGRLHLDILASNLQQLLYAGVTERNIFASEFCTMCRPDLFFSHRKERESGRVGRMLGVIGRALPSLPR